ncbi:AraC family transcriptional regulator [bacterium M00.F.Ca.ET.162.01.1.1]|nr:AraC family transcriptional regulator [bacterium M00.F.Ca.ET.205.01.1.1]TGU51035.1 AraC family transcriptional regulator [bacterium M00.F.Ca.ET.152.01.1.1]TGZ41807.1 AraC family transcriptional regulator [bacterium M00.F.Ca.ET.162.01.1.1]
MTAWPSSHSHRDVRLSPDELADAASGLPVKIDRLSPGRLLSRIRQIQSHGKWALDLAEFNCAFRASGGFDGSSVAIVAIERACDSTICGIPLEDDMIVTIPAGTSVTATVQPGLNYTGAVVPTSIWAEIQAFDAGAVVEQAADRPDAARLTTSDAKIFRSQMEAMADCFGAAASGSVPAEHTPVALMEYLGGIADALADAGGNNASVERSSSRYLRQAWAAEDFIRAHIREDMPIIRLCKEIGVSRRQLEYAFRTTFAVSPLEFIRALRLNEARRLLATRGATGLSVTRIAMEVGITHLGRFAANYRLLFGECPKETLQRAGRSWPGRNVRRRSRTAP